MTMTFEDYKVTFAYPLDDTSNDAAIAVEFAAWLADQAAAAAVPLANLKAQMNIVDDADDVFLTLVLGVATEWVAEMVGGKWDCMPAPVQHATRMLAAHLFENREAVLVGVSAAEMPLGVMTLLDPYRVWFVEDECS